MDQHRVIFWPDGKEVVVEEGTSILDAGALAGVRINNLCGGKGSREIMKGGCCSALVGPAPKGGGLKSARGAIKRSKWRETYGN